MSKTKLLLDVVSDMRSLADSLQAVAEVLAGNRVVEMGEPITTVKKPAPKIKGITLEEVRAKLAALSQDGKQAQVKDLITELGAKKLNNIPAEKYAELLKKAEEL